MLIQTSRFLKNKIVTFCASDSTCVQECPVGYYAGDKDERACKRCHFSCKSCAGRHSLQCVDCKSGFFKQGSSCVETCSERLKNTQTHRMAFSFSSADTNKLNWCPLSLSLSVTLATPTPWFVSDATPLVAGAGVLVTKTA